MESEINHAVIHAIRRGLDILCLTPLQRRMQELEIPAACSKEAGACLADAECAACLAGASEDAVPDNLRSCGPLVDW
jgi:hypothetical protein